MTSARFNRYLLGIESSDRTNSILVACELFSFSEASAYLALRQKCDRCLVLGRGRRVHALYEVCGCRIGSRRLAYRISVRVNPSRNMSLVLYWFSFSILLIKSSTYENF